MQDNYLYSPQGRTNDQEDERDDFEDLEEIRPISSSEVFLDEQVEHSVQDHKEEEKKAEELTIDDVRMK